MNTDTAPSAALLADFATCFVNRSRPYAVQERDGTYRWRYETLGEDVIAARVRGEQTLALSSSNEVGMCRWICLDVDTADGLAHLLRLRTALAGMGLPGLVEASRRGGHLWLFLEISLLVSTARAAVLVALQNARDAGAEVPEFELYPDAARGNATLGHAVRLPLGIHRLTGRRYALFDEYSLPCVFTSIDMSLRFVLARPHVDLPQFLDLAARSTRTLAEPRKPQDDTAPLLLEQATQEGKTGTRSTVIRWVDAEISPLGLLEEWAPDAEMRRQGEGYLGWCPFHDDRAPDRRGRPGTPSFYVVRNVRYGWSWRCLSTNCVHHAGPMHHSFRLLQELLGLDAAETIRAAASRWPEVGWVDGRPSTAPDASAAPNETNGGDPRDQWTGGGDR